MEGCVGWGRHSGKLTSLINGMSSYLTNFIQSQLAITIVSFPILVSWGLPCSGATFLGNLVFPPFLIAFLMVSSLLFFTQLVGVPNKLLVQALECITGAWHHLLSYGSKAWLIPCAKPPVVLLIAMPLIGFMVISNRYCNTPLKRILSMSCLLVAMYGLCIGHYHYQRAQEPCTRRLDDSLYVIRLVSNELIVVDEGFFAKAASPEKVIDYTLKPWLIKHYGSMGVKELRISKPSYRTFIAARHLARACFVEMVWLPFFDEELGKGAWREYFELKRSLEKHGVRFVRYATSKKPSGRQRGQQHSKRFLPKHNLVQTAT